MPRAKSDCLLGRAPSHIPRVRECARVRVRVCTKGREGRFTPSVPPFSLAPLLFSLYDRSDRVQNSRPPLPDIRSPYIFGPVVHSPVRAIAAPDRRETRPSHHSSYVWQFKDDGVRLDLRPPFDNLPGPFLPWRLYRTRCNRKT